MLSVKPITAFLIAACLLVASGAYSQRVNLSFDKAPLKHIFKAIEKQTGYTFFYQQSLIQQASKVTVHINDVSLLQALDICFKDQPLDYVVAGKIITIQQKAAVVPAGSAPLSPLPLVLKGVVINANDEPVPGATIMVKGGTKQTAADDNGTFVLAADSNAVIVVSSINYEKEEIPLAGRRELVVHLVQRVAGLGQVLVVGSTGYQRVGSEKITGSLVTIDSTLFNRRVSTNVLDRLDGVTSGLLFNKNIINGVNQSSMSIRGRSTIFANPEPLIVLDNFPYT
ncbi:MAG TPA: carboxypeptidase-like regulatory domain-containing protein, partial [Chitinophagaceae bacterium]|nr:carboxypeptidase-like regulatory domain-containing protein [Chitinophagaceae bacterium]